MGTVSGANTRRYHGLLVAATEPPAVRMVLLANLEVTVSFGAEQVGLSTNQYVRAIHPQGYATLESFEVDEAAVWTHQVGGNTLVKTVRVHPNENAATITFENRGSAPCQLSVRPLVCHKFYHDNFRLADFYPEFLVFPDSRTVVSHQGVSLYLEHPGAERATSTGWYYRFENERELERGLDPLDDLFCPCELRYLLVPGDKAVLVASTSEGTKPLLEPSPARPAELVSHLKSAAEKYVVHTQDRVSIIAGYPWFTDWGRDTMIALPGCLLSTGRVADARNVLTSFALQMRQGLIPNRFVDRGEKPDYNTVDATLWFGHAMRETLLAEWDDAFAVRALAWMREIIHWHVQGTKYGIHVDSSDGLLTQGEEGTQLTWMDAKIGDWVVTPRHGKPVEICALWINLLRSTAWLADKLGEDSSTWTAMADRAAASFEAKFWHPVLGHYLDTVDPADASLRPNQVIAMALPYSPCSPDHACAALERVREKLLTPRGLRTLGPDEPGYIGRYEGSMRDRDAAYHQGTVWPWLLGPFVTAWQKFHDDDTVVAQVLAEAETMLDEYGIDGVAEVYDGDAPQRPGGCPWQAWSVAELLRVTASR